MTTRLTELGALDQIRQTLRDITALNRRKIRYQPGSVEYCIDESLIEINQTVLEWQRTKAGIEVNHEQIKR